MGCNYLVICTLTIFISALFLSVTLGLLSRGQQKIQRGSRHLLRKLYRQNHPEITMVDNSMSTSNFQDLIHRFDEALCGGLKLCVIARALPGRGKTTLVQKIITHYGDSSEFTAVMSAADDFMVNSLGEYCWEQARLTDAHKQCREKLMTAIEHGVDIVCQHNTNICRWESAELQVKAEASGYIVVYIEPKYAWSRQSDIPENLRDVLVNSHGVPAEKILEMRSRMEFIAPVYLGYWARSSRLANSFAAVGIPEKALIEVLQRLTSFHDKNRKIKEGKKNCTYPTGAKVASIRPVTTIDPEQKDQKGASEQQLSDFFSEMVHITTDYDGSYKKILSIRNHEELLRNVLTPCNLQIVALFADERGIGAYVTHSTEGVAQEGKRSKTEAEEMTEIGWIDRHIRQHHNIPKYHLYTQAAFAQGQPKLSLPFMTVRIDPPSKPKDIGIAAEEFYQLLFNGTVSTNQEESETDQFLESKGIFYPNVVNVGKFSAVLFEHPVRFNSTYAYCYTGGATSMSDYTKKNVGSSPYRPQRSQNRRN